MSKTCEECKQVIHYSSDVYLQLQPAPHLQSELPLQPAPHLQPPLEHLHAVPLHFGHVQSAEHLQPLLSHFPPLQESLQTHLPPSVQQQLSGMMKLW